MDLRKRVRQFKESILPAPVFESTYRLLMQYPLKIVPSRCELLAWIFKETGFYDPAKRTEKGSYGLLQIRKIAYKEVMKEYLKELKGIGLSGNWETDKYILRDNPVVNIVTAVFILNRFNKIYSCVNHLSCALGHYNGGSFNNVRYAKDII